MDSRGEDVKNWAHTVGCESPCTLDDKCNWAGLVEKPQPPLLIARPVIAGIKKDPAPQQNPVGVGNKRACPAHVVIVFERALGAVYAIVDEGPDGSVPMPIIRSIDGIFGGVSCYGGWRNRVVKPAVVPVQREDLGFLVPQCAHKRGLRPINDKPGSDLHPARLQEMGLGAARIGKGGKNRKNRPYRDIRIDV